MKHSNKREVYEWRGDLSFVLRCAQRLPHATVSATPSVHPHAPWWADAHPIHPPIIRFRLSAH